MWDGCSAQIPGLASRRLPLGDSPDQLRIVVVPDEGPALFVADVIVGVGVPVLNEGAGVFHVTVDGLDGRFDAFLLVGDRY